MSSPRLVLHSRDSLRKVQLRDGNLRAPREVLHSGLEHLVRAGLDRLRPPRLQRKPVREPVADDVRRDGDGDEDPEERAAEERADTTG
jgi:hypothetical protein